MSKKYIVVENVVAKMGGDMEQELPVDGSIRFHSGGMDFTVKLTDTGIEVYKVSRDRRISGDNIIITPKASNTLLIS